MNADIDAAATLAAIDADLAAIDGVLHRLDDGSYGRCASCGAEISERVLESEPLRTTCSPACA